MTSNVEVLPRALGDCPICFQDMSSDKLIELRVCGSCKNAFHSNCIDMWLSRTLGMKTCTLCQVSWRGFRCGKEVESSKSKDI